MATRSEREKAQKLNETHQALLGRLLREDDNKYCADCEAKGPRWASWNLGVFVCIRCAGIHRNLGVHISRVKSVNLDQWTAEQIQSIQDMGNTRARKLYEANLPDNFRRPQTDQAVEFFIRDKYEKKKYYNKNATNGSSPKESKKEREAEKPSKVSSHPKVEEAKVSRSSPSRPAEPAVNLLGLDAPAAVSSEGGASSQSAELDIFGPMVSNPLPSSSSSSSSSAAVSFPQTGSGAAAGTPTPPAAAGAAGTGAAAGAGGGVVSSGSTPGDLDLFSETSSSSTKAEDGTKKTLSKDSILSLYGTSSMSQTGPAGLYMGASPQLSYPVASSSGFPAGFGGMGGAMPPSTVMGAMMGPAPGMMVGMTVPNGFMGNAPPPPGMMGMAPRMMAAPQGHGGMVAPPQQQGMYAIQPGQQAPWGMAQVNQQMSGLALNGVGGQMAMGQSPAAVGGWSSAGSGQTLSTQLWK